jgi:hypothetical protein
VLVLWDAALDHAILLREAVMTPAKGSLGALIVAIWALPGIGIPTLLFALQRRKRGHVGAATPNKRGQYG